MKTITFLLLSAWGILSYEVAKAQYTLFPHPPPPQFTFNDLWHMTISRIQDDGYTKFYVAMRVHTDNQQLKIKSNTTTLALPTGTHTYTMANLHQLQPFVTSYTDAGLLQQSVASGGNFPPGEYHIIYTLYGKTADGEFTPLAEDALDARVDVLWPPMLLTPGNGETLDQPLPLLTWTPAFSSVFAGQIDYTLNLVEVLPGQNEYQAIQANPTYFTERNLNNTLLPYPPAARVLETGRLYAWQVHAQAGGVSLGSSEIWTFKLATPQEPATSKKPYAYIKPSTKVSAEYIRLAKPELPIALEEGYFPTVEKFRFVIVNERMETVATEKDFTAVVKTGLNTYVVSLCSDGSRITLKKGRYILEIRTEKNGKFYIPFELDKGGNCNE